MACGSSWYEDNPARDKQRDIESARKNQAAAEKIRAFLEERVGIQNIEMAYNGTGHKADRTYLELATGSLSIEHRGYTFIVLASEPEKLKVCFEAWHRAHMNHARIRPRAN